MRVVHERCCGIDVHKETVVACVMLPDENKAGGVKQETRTFGTMTGDLQALGEWLREQGVREVVMESTGVYWKPVYNLLEGAFEIMIVNPERVKALRGKKTDVGDAEWLADLFRHGPVQQEEQLLCLHGLVSLAVTSGQYREHELLPCHDPRCLHAESICWSDILVTSCKYSLGQRARIGVSSVRSTPF